MFNIHKFILIARCTNFLKMPHFLRLVPAKSDECLKILRDSVHRILIGKLLSFWEFVICIRTCQLGIPTWIHECALFSNFHFEEFQEVTSVFFCHSTLNLVLRSHKLFFFAFSLFPVLRCLRLSIALL